MGESLVGINRRLHRVMGLLADLALAGSVVVIAVLVAGRCVLNQGTGRAAAVTELLAMLLLFLFLAWAVRDHIQIGVRLGCDWFPHNVRARMLTVFAVDALALACGVLLTVFGAGRMAAEDGFFSGWRCVPLVLAGAVLAFDSALFLTGALSHEEAYAFGRVAESQRRRAREGRGEGDQ